MKTFYTNLSGILKRITLSILSILGFAHIASAQCPVGQSEVTIDVTADQWGYECYWELVPGGNNCGTGFIFQGGNTNVGCNGGGLQTVAPGSGYGNNTTTTEGPWCLTNGSAYDIKSIDDWGDGGSVFKIYVGGSLLFTFTASMGVQTFSFTMPLGNNNNLALSAISFQTDLVSGNTPDSTAALYYYQIPLCQSQSDTIEFWGTVTNSGTFTQTNAYVTATVTGAQSFVGNSDTLASIAASTSADMMVTKTYTPAVNGTHNVVFTVASDSTDQLPANNTVAFSFGVTDTVYARDNDVPTSAYYFPSLMQYQMGNLYRMNVADTATSISMFSYWQLGSIFILHLYDASLTTPVASSPYVTVSAAEAGWNWITLPFDGGPAALVPGDYIAAFEAVSDTVYFAASGSAEPTPPVTTFIYDGTSWGYYDVTTFIRLNVKGCAGTTSCTMTSTATATKDTCNAGVGDAAVVASGGTAPYTYLWNDPAPAQSSATATGLDAGSYSVTVTDAASCTSISSVSVSNFNTNIVVNTTSTSDICNSGSGTATATITGSGIAPFAYQWAPGGKTTSTATGLSAGSYSVTVSDKYGCSATGSVTVSATPSDLSITSISSTPDTCQATVGTAAVTVSGGSSPISYLWSPGGNTTSSATGLSSGNYTVVVTDSNGCSADSSVTVGINYGTLAIDSVITTNASNCVAADGAAIVYAKGGFGGYNYLWSNSATASSATGLSGGIYGVTVSDAYNCFVSSSSIVNSTGAQQVSVASIVDVSCNGGSNGSVTLLVTGGTTPYTFSWNTSPAQDSITATGLLAGNYSATVTDAGGCLAFEQATVGEPAAIVTTDSSVSVSCNGANDGIAALLVTGGTSPYTYLWNTVPPQSALAATGLAGGNYSCLISDVSGCTVTDSVAVAEPAVLAFTDSSTATCTGSSNGAAGTIASGGTTPYSYSWNTTPVQTTQIATGLSVGTYVCTLTDANGCFVTNSVTVDSGSGFSLTDTITGSITCNAGNDGAVKVIAVGGTAPFSYLWGANTSNQTTQTATGLSANTFSVTVTDANGCTSTASVTVTEPSAISISAATTNYTSPTVKGSITLTVTGGSGSYGYLWSTTPAQTDTTATGLGVGNYSVTITDSKGCTKIGGPYPVIQTGINELGFNVEIHVVPNPTNGKFTLTMDGVKKDTYTMEIRNIIGQLISTENLNLTGNFSKAYDLSKFNKGVYLMNVKSSKGERTEKIVIY